MRLIKLDGANLQLTKLPKSYIIEMLYQLVGVGFCVRFHVRELASGVDE